MSTPSPGMLAAMLAMLSACGDGSDPGGGPPPEEIRDLEGRIVDPAHAKHKATVLLFTRTDCPISNRYAPAVNRIMAEFTPRGIDFVLVYPDPNETAAGIRKHMDTYGHACRAAHDPGHVLARRGKATITPEAAVFRGSEGLVYHGRIDDLYVDFGRRRARASTQELRDVLTAICAGRAVETETAPAVGCYIADLE